jgi:DNA-binding NarL/FixJ family response regulator
MRILFVCQEERVRQRIRESLHASFVGTATVWDAPDVADAICRFDRNSLDVILLDGDTTYGGNDADIASLAHVFPVAVVALITAEARASALQAAVRAGAMGLIPNGCSHEVLHLAVCLLMQGACYLPASVVRHLAGGAPQTGHIATAGPDVSLSELSPRQREVLDEALCGKPNKQIARDLGVSEGTVKAHLSAAFRCLGVHNRVQAVRLIQKTPTHRVLGAAFA